MNKLTEKTLQLLCSERMKSFCMSARSEITHVACYNRGTMCPDLAAEIYGLTKKWPLYHSRSRTLMDTVIHNKTTRSSRKLGQNISPHSLWQLTLCIYLGRVQDYSEI